MNPQVSTFDKLVDSLSTEEAQTMLARIAENMKMSEDIQTDSKKEPLLSNTELQKSIRINDEPFFIRFWLRLKSFFKSLPVEAVYEETLIRRTGKDLQRNYKQYINIKENIFTNDFYVLLCALRKTQLFFTSLLSAYDTDKGNFYLLVSSFVAPDVYLKLMCNTDPFTCAASSQASGNLRSVLLKKIDESFSLMTADYKTGMYRAANAIEWMRFFCELPIDKAVLRFTVNPAVEPSCSVYLLSAEIDMLASVLSTTKPIPDVVLQALFLLSKQDKLNDKTVSMDEESVEFISQASHALEAIKEFSVKIPILELARYTLKSIHWEPQRLEGGEDWFQLFKVAWKKRFTERWQLWASEQKRAQLNRQMLDLLKTDRLEPLMYRPWEDSWLVLQFKREFSFDFLASFFSILYQSFVQPVLKTLLMEGSFYRRENLAEYTNAFTVLEKQQSCISTFESRLSPEGEIGAAFIQLKEKTVASLKSKNSLEALMKNIETEAKQIITSSQEAFKVLVALLNGFIEGNKNSVYAPLLNWLTIQGNDNLEFRKRVEGVKNLLQEVSAIISDAEKIETD
ncbi:hypothetical protein C5N99_08245 [Treponema medium]|uniref:DUF5312 domain-containing protein n=1 Tax=Treponema medium TaxID=58231 RepID=UPI001982452B|nr:DUF5312 domain-containing protein [Treponema medium]QSH92583.1 hypothetical protein C5N99_08245 [Treponema medium]